MKKILIALDYDPTAQKVAEAGYELAKSMNAGITLLHVISDPVYYSDMEYSPVMGFTGYMEMGQLKSVTAERLKEASFKYLEKIRSHLGDESIDLKVEEGDFASSILQTARKIKADTIVMGSLSRKWLENILMGSVAEKVLHQTEIPLYIVPTKKK
jgi:nucleotide-binding universal stress UspA family protein